MLSRITPRKAITLWRVDTRRRILRTHALAAIINM